MLWHFMALWSYVCVFIFKTCIFVKIFFHVSQFLLYGNDVIIWIGRLCVNLSECWHMLYIFDILKARETDLHVDLTSIFGLKLWNKKCNCVCINMVCRWSHNIFNVQFGWSSDCLNFMSLWQCAKYG
jgi:hypothetical protein